MIDPFNLKMKFSSIKFRFAFIAALVSLIGFGVAIHFSTRWMAEEIQEDYKEKAGLMGTHIIHDLENAMLRINHEEIFHTLDIYKTYKDVKEVRVFNTKGEEVFVQGQGRHEPLVGEALKTGEPIQYQHEINQQKMTALVIPIRNKSTCHRCHGESEPLRGALFISLNQESMESYIGEQTRKFIVLFVLLTAGVAIAAAVTVHRLFLRPLKSIQKGAGAVEQGEFNHRIPVKSNDEVGNLAGNFNRMAQTLGSLFKSLEEKQLELAEQHAMVSRAEEEWQETFDCITDPVAVMSSDCTIIKANRAFHETFKERFVPLQGEANHHKCSELFGTCLLSDCPHRKILTDGTTAIREIEDGTTGKIFQISIFPYYASGGTFDGSITILKDITEQKEDEIRRFMRERLSAIGEVVSSVAHEINNPLATIGVSAEGLLKRVRDGRFNPSLFENYLEVIREEIDRSRKITEGMLSFVRKNDSKKEDINIHEVLNKTLEMLSFQGRLSNIEVLKDYQKEIGAIRGNEGELRQVFLSIINNAIEAMEMKGKLKLETINLGDKVSTRITDTGPGIPQGHVERIFTPFFTTKSEKGGTGLGLFIAKRIIEENGGSIDVSSEERKGATFTITLPI